MFTSIPCHSELSNSFLYVSFLTYLHAFNNEHESVIKTRNHETDEYTQGNKQNLKEPQTIRCMKRFGLICETTLTQRRLQFFNYK